MSAGFDRNKAGRQNFKFTAEGCDRRRQEATGDDLPLIVQNAEMAPSVAKINANCHSSCRLLFHEVLQHSHRRVSLHSLLSCSCTLRVQVDEAAYCNRSSPPFSSHLEK